MDLLVELERCPACDSTDIAPFFASTNANGPIRFEQLLFRRLGLPWRPVRFDACQRCGLAFLNPRWTPHALGRIYGPENLYRVCAIEAYKIEQPGATEEDYFRFIDDTVSRPDSTHASHLGRARWARGRLPKTFPERPLAADVGAGFGAAQRAIEKAGFEYRGFESSAEMVAYAARHQRSVRCVPFSDVAKELRGEAHLVYTAQFLEHVDSPVSCLESLRPCLRDDGYVFVDVPTCHYKLLDDALVLTGGQRRTTMNWGHMNLFDEESLANAMILAGFDPVAHHHDSGNIWMLGKKTAAVPAGSLQTPDMNRLTRHVHAIDPAVEPVATALLRARRRVRDTLASAGLLETARAVRRFLQAN